MDSYENEYREDDVEYEEDQTDEINEAEAQDFKRMMEFRKAQQQYALQINGINPMHLLQQTEQSANLPSDIATQSFTQPLSPAVTTPVSRQLYIAQIQQPPQLAQNATSPATCQNTNEVSDEILIQTVKDYEIIWGTSGRSFKDTERKNRCWIEIGQTLESERKFYGLSAGSRLPFSSHLD